MCVLSLDERRAQRVVLNDSARLTGVDCAVFINSSSTIALSASDESQMSAIAVHVVGGYEGDAGRFSPTPLSDAPRREDPLRTRGRPSFGGCDHTNMVLDDVVMRLSPGVYCGGLIIKGDSRISIAPGAYIIKDGRFEISDNAEVAGEQAGFFLTGVDARFEFIGNASVELSGPESGALAGLIIYQDRVGVGEFDSRILSPNVSKLVGTIYLPRGDLFIDTDSEVAEASAFTAIIVDELHLSASAHLILNSDYEATSVPMPPGMDGILAVRLRG